SARHEILLESYSKKIQIATRAIGEIVTSLVAPAPFPYQNEPIENTNGLTASGLKREAHGPQFTCADPISSQLKTILVEAEAMRQERKKANVLDDAREKAIAYDTKVKPYFDKIRYHLNKLEQIVDDRQWPLPKLRELLFVR